jgi:hypothetical protein
MGKSYEALKGKLAACKAWLAVKLGNDRLAELEARHDEHVELLKLAGQMLDVSAKQQDGAMNAFGLLQQQSEQSERNAVVTIASLLTVNGGEVSVTADTIRAVEKSDITIDYCRADDGTVTLKLVPPDELTTLEADDDAVEVGGDEETCDGDCQCGQKPEAAPTTA